MREGTPEPSELVIWGASTLLALVAGVGGAFFLWMALRRSGFPLLSAASVILVGVGIALIGLSADRPLLRISLVLLACVLALAYTFGGPEFALLTP
jgi:hypothetical protein